MSNKRAWLFNIGSFLLISLMIVGLNASKVQAQRRPGGASMRTLGGGAGGGKMWHGGHSQQTQKLVDMMNRSEVMNWNVINYDPKKRAQNLPKQKTATKTANYRVTQSNKKDLRHLMRPVASRSRTKSDAKPSTRGNQTSNKAWWRENRRGEDRNLVVVRQRPKKQSAKPAAAVSNAKKPWYLRH